MRTLSFIGLASTALIPSLSAQQVVPKRQAPSARIWINGEEVPDRDLLLRRRARLGISVDLRASENDSVGATIEAVTPGGPAAKAGVRSGDIVIRFNSKVLATNDGKRAEDDQSLPGLRLVEWAAKLQPNDTVSLEVRRGDIRNTLAVIAAKERFGADGAFSLRLPDMEPLGRPGLPMKVSAPMAFSYDRMPMFGGAFADLEVAPINTDLGSYFGTTEGVLVINVGEKSNLQLKSGDVILSVDGRKPSGPNSLMRILRSYEEGDPIRFEIMRNHRRETVSGKVADRE